MPDLKLRRLPDRTPVKITISVKVGSSTLILVASLRAFIEATRAGG